jgi:hypothetical protein
MFIFDAQRRIAMRTYWHYLHHQRTTKAKSGWCVVEKLPLSY